MMLRAHTGAQFDPEIVAAFEQVVDDDGGLKVLDASIEQQIARNVYVPPAGSYARQPRRAAPPVSPPPVDEGSSA
jgi:hypothetical protein